MPDHHTTLDLLGHHEPVTVSWFLEHDRGESWAEIECVMSDRLGELTDLVLNSACCTTGLGGSLYGGFRAYRVPDTGWQDPVRRAMFGQLTCYQPGDPRVRPDAVPYTTEPAVNHYVAQREAVRTVLTSHGTMHDRLRWEIEDSEAFLIADYDRGNDW